MLCMCGVSHHELHTRMLSNIILTVAFLSSPSISKLPEYAILSEEIYRYKPVSSGVNSYSGQFGKELTMIVRGKL